MVVQLIDTHTHLDYLVRGNLPEVPAQSPGPIIERARAAGVVALLNPGVSPERYDDILALVDQFDMVYAAVGVHPCEVQHHPDEVTWLAKIDALLHHPKVLAVGETGLDYYHSTQYIKEQQRCFKAQLRLAAKHRKPVIVHDRDAHEDVATIIASVQNEFDPATYPLIGVMHCFSGDVAFAHRMLALGFYISFAGNVSFKNAQGLRDAALVVPLDRLLIENRCTLVSACSLPRTI
jgi:TatD DNase family protein